MTNRCQHTFLDLPDGLFCDSPDHPENPGGHTYSSSSVSDSHTESEDAAERGRG